MTSATADTERPVPPIGSRPSGGGPSADDLRRAWLLLRDPFATPAKGARVLLLLGWMAWFPPRQFGGGVLLVVFPACVAALGFWTVLRSRRLRRGLEGMDGDELRADLEDQRRKGAEGRTALLVMAPLMVVMLLALLLMAFLGPRSPGPEDFAVPSLGILILWGMAQGASHVRQLDRLLNSVKGNEEGRPHPAG